MGAQKTVMEKILELGEKSRKSRITGIWKFLFDKFKWDFGTKIKGKSEDQKSKFIVSKIISDVHYIGGRLGEAREILWSVPLGFLTISWIIPLSVTQQITRIELQFHLEI